MHVDRAQFDVNVRAPDGFQQFFARKDVMRLFHQKLQQAEFRRSQMHEPVAAEDAAGRQIHFDVFERQFAFGFHGLGAAQQSADPRDQLGNGKRFRHIVVRADRQPFDFVGFLAARGQHDDRHAAQIVVVAHQLADIDAADPRQHPVQQNQRRTPDFDRVERLCPVGDGFGFKPLFFQIVAQQGDDVFLVLDDHDFIGHGQSFGCGVQYSRKRSARV